MKSEVQKTIEDLRATFKQAQALEENYKNKVKGEVYDRRLQYLQKRFTYFTEKMGKLGTGKIIQYKITLEEPESIFQVVVNYDTKLSQEDIETLVKFRYEPVHIVKIEKVGEIALGEFSQVKN